MLRKTLLVCGILSSMLYAAMMVCDRIRGVQPHRTRLPAS